MYEMEISAEKTKIMTNSASYIPREIRVKELKLGTSLALVLNDGSKPDRFMSHCNYYKAEANLEK